MITSILCTAIKKFILTSDICHAPDLLYWYLQIIAYDSNPSRKEVEQGFAQISAKLRDGKKKTPMKRYLVIFLFAGHGLQKDG